MISHQSAYRETNLTHVEIMKLERLDRHRQRQYDEYVRLLKEEAEEEKKMQAQNEDAKKNRSKIKPPPHTQIQYSEKYYDDKYEYRHVRIPSVS